MNSETTVGVLLDQIPIGRFHRRLLLIVGSAWAFAAMEIILISFALPKLLETWSLSGLQAGFLGSASLIGMVIGSWVGGWHADRVGRIRAFQATVLTYSLGTGITALAIGFPSAILCRILTGIGVGGTATVGTAYLSEHLPTNRRGRYLAYLDAFWAIGTIIAVIISWVFLIKVTQPLNVITGIDSWRLLFLFAAIPIGLLFFVRSLGETPYYLVEQGQENMARQRLRWIAQANGVTLESNMGPLTTPDSETEAGFHRLFQPDLLRRTLTISLAWFGLNFGYYGVFIWLPQTIGAADIVGGIYMYLFLVAIMQIPGYLSAAYLVDTIGRRTTLAIYLGFSGIFTFFFASAMPDVSFSVVTGFWPFLIGLLAASFFSLGSFGAIRAYTPELFPTEVRATGAGFTEGTGRIAGIFGPVVAGFFVQFGYFVALTPLAIAFTAAGIVVFAFGVKTHGHTLY